ncbi:glycoside hydrolase family 25 protein [Dinghuibacter silviterrae]|uniref:Lysozyme n=1 Tax=Dinghuibacter silviterrae TaxID=1539049 RepID=A0A4R8DIY3_9BACT|nr:glycoside hydrolase family 25 protein [Dinghuibacter silviterrae]TDW97478.1 lysozyme [Dinghuibacter silviterrae]
MTKGIDVSHLNGQPGHHPIDWQQVAKATTPHGSVKFAFIKATEGVAFDDPATASNAQEAKAAGVSFGYYHFAHPATYSASDEASHFYRRVTGLTTPTFTYPFALDLETNSNPNTKASLSPANYLAWVEQFMTVFLGHFGKAPVPEIIIYGAPDFLDRNLPATHTLGEQYKLWVAHVNVAVPRLPKGWSDWTLWQYSWNETVTGVANPTLDADLAKI